MCNCAGGNRWLLGTVLEEMGPVSAQVDVRGTAHRSHHGQLRPCRVSGAGKGSEPTHMPVSELERAEVGYGYPAPEENVLSPERPYPD